MKSSSGSSVLQREDLDSAVRSGCAHEEWYSFGRSSSAGVGDGMGEHSDWRVVGCSSDAPAAPRRSGCAQMCGAKSSTGSRRERERMRDVERGC